MSSKDLIKKNELETEIESLIEDIDKCQKKAFHIVFCSTTDRFRILKELFFAKIGYKSIGNISHDFKPEIIEEDGEKIFSIGYISIGEDITLRLIGNGDFGKPKLIKLKAKGLCNVTFSRVSTDYSAVGVNSLCDSYLIEIKNELRKKVDCQT